MSGDARLRRMLDAAREAEERFAAGEAPGIRYVDLTHEERIALLTRRAPGTPATADAQIDPGVELCTRPPTRPDFGRTVGEVVLYEDLGRLRAELLAARAERDAAVALAYAEAEAVARAEVSGGEDYPDRWYVGADHAAKRIARLIRARAYLNRRARRMSAGAAP